jgi:hypothetical protein
MLGTDAMMDQSDSSNLGNPSKEKGRQLSPAAP